MAAGARGVYFIFGACGNVTEEPFVLILLLCGPCALQRAGQPSRSAFHSRWGGGGGAQKVARGEGVGREGAGGRGGLVWFGSRPVPDALAHGQHSPLCRHDWARRIAVVRSQGLPDC